VKEPDRALIEKAVQEAQKHIRALVQSHFINAIAFIGEEGVTIPCLAGYPTVTVPYGADNEGYPLGATFFAMAGQDEFLMNLAYAFEQGTNLRMIPEKYLQNEQR